MSNATLPTSNGAPAAPHPAPRSLQAASGSDHREPLDQTDPWEAAGPVPFAIHAVFDDLDDPSELLRMLAMQAFISGDQPWLQMERIDRVRADATLLPPGTEPLRVAIEPIQRVTLARGDGWTLCVKRRADRSARLLVTATTQDLGETILQQATADAAEPPPPPEQPSVMMGFWQPGAYGPQRRVRPIDIISWQEIQANYAAAARAALDDVMALTPERVSGRVLLLHGPSGTGKTTALQALAHAWKDWCEVDYVPDPEHMLNDPVYLMEVATDNQDDGSGCWRLVLLEDCDELISEGAKASSGQALARLLNLTDGLLGRGLKVLFGITTNEPLARLHPAMVRPGRCLAEIEVPRLPHEEAAAWLGAPAGIPGEGATLAELYQLKGNLHKVQTAEPTPAAAGGGMYL